MQLIYIHQYFVTPSVSGGVRSYEMARRLVARGHTVHLITSSAMFDQAEHFEAGWNVRVVDGIRVHVLRLPYSNKMGFIRRLWAFFCFLWQATLRARALPANLVLASSTPLTVGIPGVFASRLKKIPLVFEVRDLWPKVPIAMGILNNKMLIRCASILERWIYENSTHVIALSPGMAKGVIDVCDVPVSIIPNASDVEFFEQMIGSERFDFGFNVNDSKIVIYAGTLGRVNNIDYIVDLARFSVDLDSSVKFVLMGTGSEEERIRSAAAGFGVLDVNIFIVPPVPKKILPTVLSRCACAISTVLPIEELWDNSANKFFDALAAGRPIAINHYGWQADTITKSKNGVVLDPHSAANGARALISMLNNAERCSSAGAASRQLALEIFSREKLFAEFERVLVESVIAK